MPPQPPLTPTTTPYAESKYGSPGLIRAKTRIIPLMSRLWIVVSDAPLTIWIWARVYLRIWQMLVWGGCLRVGLGWTRLMSDRTTWTGVISLLVWYPWITSILVVNYNDNALPKGKRPSLENIVVTTRPRGFIYATIHIYATHFFYTLSTQYSRTERNTKKFWIYDIPYIRFYVLSAS